MMKLYINNYEHKEYMEKLMGICPLCLLESIKADITFILDSDDDPYLDSNELQKEEIYYGNGQ